MLVLKRAVFISLALAFFLAPVLLFSQNPPLNEDPAELVNLNLGESNVSLLLTGTWKGGLQGNLGFVNSPLGLSFSSPETPLLFFQEADITLSLWLNQKWFVEANFQDNSSLNTYRAGFQGYDSDFVKYAGIGNTGLDFPSFSYLDLGGDSPSSFGFYSRMGTSDLDIHALFRYDTASREERVFSGGRERTTVTVETQNYIRAVSFVLPEENIDSEITVYIEDEKGALRDTNGRRWRIALHNEYAAGQREGLLELGIRPGGMVAVSYNGAGSNMGSYDGSVIGFLTIVQQWFYDPDRTINLEDYPQCGNGKGSGAAPGFVTINGVSALVIYEPGAFSPFERQNRYDAPSSASEKAALVRLSSGQPRSDFELLPLSSSGLSGEIPVFSAVTSRRHVYELLPVSESDYRSCATLWPLAKEYPEIYLQGNNKFTGDVALMFTNYGGSSGYLIGTDVVAGSVQVWRSGIQDSNFSYNPARGEVILHSSAGQNEIIRITYLKKSEETRLGSIAAGLGAVYQKEASPFSIQGALGVRWNLTEADSFTEEGNSSAGNVGASAKASWDYDNLKARIGAGFAYVETDTTGLYRVSGMEGQEIVLSLPSDTSFVSNTPSLFNPALRADLIYRNYYSSSVLGSTLMPITWNASSVVPGLNRPYPVKDPLLGDMQNLVAEFNLNPGEWTGFQVLLGNDGDFVSRAGEIIIPFRLYDFSAASLSALRLRVQIGSLSPKDFPFDENTHLVWEADLYPGVVDENGRGLAVFKINETERLSLSGAKYLRIIAENTSVGIQPVSGRVILAPPVIRAAAFRPVTVNNGKINAVPDYTEFNRVTAYETHEESSSLVAKYPSLISRLHPGAASQRVLKIDWENMQSGIYAGVDGRTGELALSDYRELSFFIRFPTGFNGSNIVLTVADGPESINKPYLRASVPVSEFPQGEWSKVTIRYQGENTGIKIDGRYISSPSFTYNRPRMSNNANKINYASFYFETDSALKDAVIYIDEIIQEDPGAVYRINAGSSVDYAKKGNILSLGGFSILSDFNISSAVESEFRLDENNSDFLAGAVNSSSVKVNVLGADIHGNASFSASRDDFLWTADHGVSYSIRGFSFGESFYASPSDNSSRHNLNISYLSDFFAKFEADALYEDSKLKQRWNYGAGYRTENEFIPSVSLNAAFSWIKNSDMDRDGNYAELWIDSWRPLLPDNGFNAASRNASSQIVITQGTRPVGAVLSAEGNSVFTGVNNITKSESSLFLDVPVNIDKTNLNFRMGRSFKKHIFFSGNDVADDVGIFFESIGDSMPLWGVFPFYSLFAPDLNDAMDSAIGNYDPQTPAQYSSFNDHFSIRLVLPVKNNFSSFFIPSRGGLRVERLIEQKMDTRSDILSLSATAGFSSLNMFGAMGFKPVFKFYQTDEFSHSIQGAFIFNNNNEVSWRMQSVIGAGFRGAGGGNLTFVNNFTLRSGGYWLESLSCNWTTGAKKTLINLLYGLIANAAIDQNTWPALASLFGSPYDQLRKESLEIIFDYNNDYPRWNIILGHEEIIRVAGRLEFTGFVKLRFGEDFYRQTFALDALLGTTLRVNF